MSNSALWWAMGAAVPAVTLEYLYRTMPGTYAENFLYFLPLQVVISYCIYQLVRQPGTSLVDAFVVWALCTTFLRVAVTVGVLHDQVKFGTWLALGLLILARVSQVVWGR